MKVGSKAAQLVGLLATPMVVWMVEWKEKPMVEQMVAS